MDNFYVLLPSNVKSFPQNTITNFRTRLASRLLLTDDWEVGLVEISYTLSWYNIPKEEEFSLIYYENGLGKRYSKGLSLPAGRYDRIQQVIEIINNQLNQIDIKDFDFLESPSLEVKERSRKITLNQGILKSNKIIFVEFSKDLCEILGFSKKEMDKKYGSFIINYYANLATENVKKGIDNINYKYDEPESDIKLYTAENPYELSGGCHSLFIYSNIVSPSFVGDSYTQLLRLVEIPNNYKFGEQVKLTYPNTYYIPVLVKDFDVIEIDIKDDMGMNIPFEFGRSIITPF
jgi:hypothetical protein